MKQLSFRTPHSKNSESSVDSVAVPGGPVIGSTRRMKGQRSRAQFSALEARTLYSADLGLAGSIGLGESNLEVSTVNVGSKAIAYDPDSADIKVLSDSSEDSDNLLSKLAASPPNPNQAHLELVLIDSRVPDIEALRADLKRQSDAGRNLAVLVIDVEADGIARATQMLAAAGQKVSAIHLISHGQDASFSLGSSLLDAQSIEDRSGELAGWSRYLSSNADLLIYGCDVAGDLRGEQFVSRLGEITGTNVAASKDLTGAKALGGNWDLEYQSGEIHHASVTTSDLQSHWQGLLAETVINANTTGDQRVGVMPNGHNIAVNANGEVVVTWEDLQAGKVMARVFNELGQALTGDITVAVINTANQYLERANPVVAVSDVDGSFVVAWAAAEHALSTNSDSIFAQRFSSNGTPIGTSFDVTGSVQHNYVRAPDIAMDAQGDFVIAYQWSDQVLQISDATGALTVNDWSITASGFNANAIQTFSNILVGSGSGGTSSTFGNQQNPAIAMNHMDGSFVIAWQYISHDTSAVPGYLAANGHSAIASERFNANGSTTPHTEGGATYPMWINEILPLPKASPAIGTNELTQPGVALANDGSILVTFSGTIDSGSTVIATWVGVQQYLPNGSAGAQTQVSGPSAGLNYNESSSVAFSSDGHAIVAWVGRPTNTSTPQIYTRGYDLSLNPGVITQLTNTNSYSEPGLAINPANRNIVTALVRQNPTQFDLVFLGSASDPALFLPSGPSIAAPATLSATEDTTLTLNGANAITVSDSNAGTQSLTVTLAIPATEGLLKLTDKSGTTVTTGTVAGTSVSGASISFRGTLSQINAALGTLQFIPVANQHNSVALTVSTAQLFGYSADGNLTNSVVNINVSPVNDSPVMQQSVGTLSLAYSDTVNFGTLGLLSVSDIDVPNPSDLSDPNNIIQMRIDYLSGSLSAGAPIAQLQITSGPGWLTLRGAVSKVNEGLNALVFTPSVAPSGGSNQLNFTLDDLGNGGAGGALQVASSLTVNVGPRPNQAPSISFDRLVASSQEDVNAGLRSLFSASTNTLGDIDASPTSILQLNLSINTGSLALDVAIANLTDVTTGAALTVFNQASLKVHGTLADLNSLMDAIQFRPVANFNGSVNLAVSLDDLSTAANRLTSALARIDVLAVNDGPLVTAPLDAFGTEDTAITFSLASSNLITIGDPDGNVNVEVQLDVGQGLLTLGATNGLSFMSGDGTQDARMRFSGTVSDINAALAGLTLQPNPNFYGDTALSIQVNDLGNTGSGGPLIASHQVAIHLQSVNDAPTLVNLRDITQPAGSVAVLTQVNLLTTDLESSADKVTYTLNATPSIGNLMLNGAILRIGDSFTQQALIDGRVAYQSFSASLGIEQISLTARDELGAATSAMRLNVVVLDVNDAPLINAPLDVFGTEDTALVFSISPNNFITVSDPDGNVMVEVQIEIGQGLITLGNTRGLSFQSGDGSQDAAMRFTGSVNDINVALAGLNILPTSNFFGDTALRVSVNDLGNSGLGGPLSDSRQVAIHLQGVNDLPTLVSLNDIDQQAGALSGLTAMNLLSTDLESSADKITYSLNTALSKGALMLNGITLKVGDSFTQQALLNGQIAYQSFGASSGDELISLTARDEAGGAAPAVQLVIHIRADTGLGGSASSAGAAAVTTPDSGVKAIARTDAKAQSLIDGGESLGPTLGPNVTPEFSAAPSNGSSRDDKLNQATGSAETSSTRISTLLKEAVSQTPLSQVRLDLNRPFEAASMAHSDLGQSAINPSTLGKLAESEDFKKPGPGEAMELAKGIILPKLEQPLERIVADAGFQRGMNQSREDVLLSSPLDRSVVASSIGVSASFTIGYLLWLVRGGVIISSMLASLPAWRLVDPLPVLNKIGGSRRDMASDKEDLSLEEMVAKPSQAFDESLNDDENIDEPVQGKESALA